MRRDRIARRELLGGSNWGWFRVVHEHWMEFPIYSRAWKRHYTVSLRIYFLPRYIA